MARSIPKSTLLDAWSQSVERNDLRKHTRHLLRWRNRQSVALGVRLSAAPLGTLALFVVEDFGFQDRRLPGSGELVNRLHPTWTHYVHYNRVGCPVDLVLLRDTAEHSIHDLVGCEVRNSGHLGDHPCVKIFGLLRTPCSSSNLVQRLYCGVKVRDKSYRAGSDLRVAPILELDDSLNHFAPSKHFPCL